MKLKDIINEESYKNNIGMQEMFKFYQIASAEQKAKMQALLAAKKKKEVLQLLQDVTGVKLHPIT